MSVCVPGAVSGTGAVQFKGHVSHNSLKAQEVTFLKV